MKAVHVQLTREDTPTLLAIADEARKIVESGNLTCESVLGEMPNEIFYAVGSALVRRGYSVLDPTILSLADEIKVVDLQWSDFDASLDAQVTFALFYAVVHAVEGYLRQDEKLVRVGHRNSRRYWRAAGPHKMSIIVRIARKNHADLIIKLW